MPRVEKPRADTWHDIAVRTSPQMRAALRGLVATGLYGFSIEDAAERILCKHIERELTEPRGFLQGHEL